MKFINEDAQFPAEDTSAAQLQASDAGTNRFLEARFGLSVHWGLYTLTRQPEWVYYQQRIPLESYRKLMERFNPQRFDAEEWADLMLEAGQRFLLITSKHHDGFCLWDTDLSDFKVTHTPFRRDILGELAPALRDRGIGLHFYYSLLDWTHRAYRNDWQAYVDYYQGQLRELLTRYGAIDGVLFDGYWPRTEFEGDEPEWFAARGAWDLAGTYDLIHSLQLDAVVTNNAHILPTPGEDYQVWELDYPGENTIGFNGTKIGDKPKAAWWNLNQHWDYVPGNHIVKSADEILRNMDQAYSRGCDVFLLNVGPRPWGDIHPDEQSVLREIGARRRSSGL